MENVNHIEIEVLKSEIKKLEHDITDLSKRIGKIETSREKTEFQYTEIMKALDKLNDVTIPNLMKEVENLKSKPGKRYETIIAAFTSGIVAFVVSLLFK